MALWLPKIRSSIQTNSFWWHAVWHQPLVCWKRSDWRPSVMKRVGKMWKSSTATIYHSTNGWKLIWQKKCWASSSHLSHGTTIIKVSICLYAFKNSVALFPYRQIFPSVCVWWFAGFSQIGCWAFSQWFIIFCTFANTKIVFRFRISFIFVFLTGSEIPTVFQYKLANPKPFHDEIHRPEHFRNFMNIEEGNEAADVENLFQ